MAQKGAEGRPTSQVRIVWRFREEQKRNWRKEPGGLPRRYPLPDGPGTGGDGDQAVEFGLPGLDAEIAHHGLIGIGGDEVAERTGGILPNQIPGEGEHAVMFAPVD